MAKIRKGFVSNSSSSSFVVISGPLVEYDWSSQCVDLGGGIAGESEFGWGPDYYYDVHSRINFTYLQTNCISDPRKHEWLELIEQAIKEHTGATDINWVWSVTKYNDEYESFNGYIDHQSAASEGQNIEMFDNIETMKQFLFGANSYIRTDNDNYDTNDYD